MPAKKKTGVAQPAEGRDTRWRRPWELGDPDWETMPTSQPTYEPWRKGFPMERLEITLDSLRQSQLWLSNSLRLLADSVNTDQNERDLLVFEMREKIQSMGWHIAGLETKISELQAKRAAQEQDIKDTQNRLDTFHLRLLALERVERGTACGPSDSDSAAELRQDISDQLLRMATLLNNKHCEEPTESSLSLQARIRAAQDVARVLRSPARSVGTSRAQSPAPSVRL